MSPSVVIFSFHIIIFKELTHHNLLDIIHVVAADRMTELTNCTTWAVTLRKQNIQIGISTVSMNGSDKTKMLQLKTY